MTESGHRSSTGDFASSGTTLESGYGWRWRRDAGAAAPSTGAAYGALCWRRAWSEKQARRNGGLSWGDIRNLLQIDLLNPVIDGSATVLPPLAALGPSGAAAREAMR
jgi:hypothetical protein